MECSLAVELPCHRLERVSSGGGCFQMPLHYPKYTAEDYKSMPEWKLDCLLLEYGLPVVGTGDQRRKFAMGAFLWVLWNFLRLQISLLKQNTIDTRNKLNLILFYFSLFIYFGFIFYYGKQ